MAKTHKIDKLLIRPAQLEDFLNIREFLLESSSLYPGIEFWWDKRVRPDLELGRRKVLVVDGGDDELEGLFIGKPGKSVKICTLRLRESIRNLGIGRALITEGLKHLLSNETDKFHVTISENAEEGCTAFFESIGFRQIAIEPSRYRSGVDEFVYACPRNEIVEIIQNELSLGIDPTLFGSKPKFLPNDRILLMSIRPEFADMILQGRKTIEFRRKFSEKYRGSTIVFYITSPVQQFMFTATISDVAHNEKKNLWRMYNKEGGVSQKVFDQYFSGTEHGYAIQLSNLKQLTNRLKLKHAKRFCPQLRPPQSFQILERKSPLVRALDLPVHI